VLLRQNANSLPFTAASARLVLVFEVPPLTQAPWFAQEVSRVLSPGGALVCTFHNPLSWRGGVVRLHGSLRSARRARTWGPYEGPTFARFRTGLRANRLVVRYERGAAWAPLRSSSDSLLVGAFARLEQLAGLAHVPALSPTVVVVALKSGDADG
jgi:hypothetical protein